MDLIKRVLQKMERPTRLRPPAADVPGAAVSECINRFAIDIYGLLSQDDEEGNLLLSPFSVASALAMILTGARGATAEQLADVLHFAELGDQLRAELREIRTLHERFDSWEKVDLRVANGLWGHQAYEFLENFREDLREVFGGVLRDVDFRSNAKSVCREVNDWVSDITNGRIQDLVNPVAINHMTRLILVNALYFRAEWNDMFDPEMTRDEPFSLLDGRHVKTPMMHRTQNYAYGETHHEQVLAIPYIPALDMIVVLPKKAGAMGRLEEKIQSGAVRPWDRGMGTREIALSLPRFRIETEVDLSRRLRSMGMTEAFDRSRADLTGIASRESMEASENLYLQGVYHKTFIEVDETGTEAAAATADIAFGAALNPPPPVIMNVDHPFLFLIRVRRTGMILLMGRLADPSRRTGLSITGATQ